MPYRTDFEGFEDIPTWSLSPCDVEAIGNNLFESALKNKAGWAWINFNHIQDKDKFLGKLIRRNKLLMNYTRRSGKSSGTRIPFKFDEAKEIYLILQGLLEGTHSTIDYLVIPPSNREKVTKVKDEDCYFVELKVSSKNGGYKFSPHQREIFPDIANSVNLYLLKINLSMNPTIELEKISYID